MERLLDHLRLACVIVLLGAWPAWSQTTAQSSEQVPHQWSHGTTLALSGGIGTASDGTGAVLGGTIGWEITPRIGVEGTATWLDRQTGSSAFAASLTAHALLAGWRRLSPFVEGGFGMYLAKFDPERVANIPSFYADRMSGIQTETFTDPAFFVGAGVDLFRTNHFRFRPVAGAIVAFTGSSAYTVGTFTLRAEYHFEDHPIQLSR
jgi:hypothetical protein